MELPKLNEKQITNLIKAQKLDLYNKTQMGKIVDKQIEN